MKELIKNTLTKLGIAKWVSHFFLRLHTFAYERASRWSIIAENGEHPKHKILRYKEWFIERCNSSWNVLEVGSHTGVFSFALAKKVKQIYAIEIMEKMIKQAIKIHSRENIQYICADATQYDYSSCEPIDCVVLSNVIEHIDDRVSFLKKLIANIPWREASIKRFLIRVPMLEREWIAVYKKEQKIPYLLDKTHFVEYTKEQLCAELQSVGMSIVDLDIRFGEAYICAEVTS